MRGGEIFDSTPFGGLRLLSGFSGLLMLTNAPRGEQNEAYYGCGLELLEPAQSSRLRLNSRSARPSETRRGLAFCIGKSQSHDQAWINILDEQPGFYIISPSSI